MSAPEPLKQLSQIPMTGSAPLVSALDSPKSVCKQAPTAAGERCLTELRTLLVSDRF